MFAESGYKRSFSHILIRFRNNSPHFRMILFFVSYVNEIVIWRTYTVICLKKLLGHFFGSNEQIVCIKATKKLFSSITAVRFSRKDDK